MKTKKRKKLPADLMLFTDPKTEKVLAKFMLDKNGNFVIKTINDFKVEKLKNFKKFTNQDPHE